MSNIGYRDEDSPRYDIGGHIAEPGAGGTWKLTAKPEAIPEPEPQFAADLGARMMAMIAAVDTWLDEQCGPAYKEQPLAQTWARLCKDQEEKGESIAELILATGQNPRKRDQAGSRDRICEELADRSVTSLFAIQHLTKDARETLVYFLNAMARAAGRAEQAGYPS